MQLAKEDKINLVKEGAPISNINFGINWGCIEKSSMMGLKKTKTSVDLDAAAFCFGPNGESVADCFTNLLGGKLDIGFLKHSGDDLTGDVDGDDGSDNETITSFISRIPESVSTIVFTANSFSRQTFDEIPFVGVRIYEGTPNTPTKMLATFNMVNNESFKNKLCAVIGKLYRRNGGWNFQAIGDTFNVSGIINIKAEAKKYV